MTRPVAQGIDLGYRSYSLTAIACECDVDLERTQSVFSSHKGKNGEICYVHVGLLAEDVEDIASH